MKAEKTTSPNAGNDNKNKIKPSDRAMLEAWQFLTQNNAAKATEICTKILTEEPENPKAHTLMGLIKQKQGDYFNAIKSLLKAIDLDPNDPVYYHNLGHIYIKARMFTQALPLLKKATEIAPKYADTHYLLADVLAKLGKYEEAKKSFRTAIELKEGFAEAYEALALVHERLGEDEEALKILDEADAATPNNPLILFVKGKIKRKAHELGDAQKFLEKALTNISTNRDVDLLTKARIYSEIALIAEKDKEYKKAFEKFSVSQEFASKYSSVYFADRSKELTIFNNIVQVSANWFTEKEVKTWKNYKIKDRKKEPVFLVGFPRSGTTLLEQVLASHENISVLDEKDIVMNVIKKLGTVTDTKDTVYPDVLSQFSEEQVTKVRDMYDQGVKANLPDAKDGDLIIDKMPMNIIHLGLINRIFPDAKIISLVRDPRDVILSCFCQLFDHNAAMLNFYTLEDTVKIYNLIMGIYLNFKKVLPLDILELKYEDLVLNPEKQVKDLLSFLGEKWDPEVLNFYKNSNKRFVATPSYEAVSKPINKDAIGKWKNYEANFKPHADAIKKFTDALGYK